MLEEITAAAQTLEFELYHGDHCVAKAPRGPQSRGVVELGRKRMSV
jgi:hypothetical protein